MLKALKKTQFLFLMGLLSVIWGCSPIGEPSQFAVDTGDIPQELTTGNTVTYTHQKTGDLSPRVSTLQGNQLLYNHIASEISTDDVDADLFIRIRDVQLDIEKKENQIHGTLEVSLKENSKRSEGSSSSNGDNLYPDMLKFELQLQPNQGSELLSHEVGSVNNEDNAPYRFYAQVRCLQLDCKLADIRIRTFEKNEENPTDPNFKGVVGLTYQVSHPDISLEPHDDDKERSDFVFERLNDPTRTLVTRKSVTLIYGPSFSYITFTDKKSQQLLLALKADAVSTQEGPIEARVTEQSLSDTESISTSLVGNDPESGSLIIDTQAHRQSSPPGTSGQRARLIIGSSSSRSTPADSSLSAEDHPVDIHPQQYDQRQKVSGPIGNHSVFWVDRRISRVARTSNLFYRLHLNSPETQRMIRVLQGSEVNTKGLNHLGRSRMERFLSFAPIAAPYIEDIFHSLRVSPEFGYILAVESNYIVNGFTDRHILNQISTASGPWQIINGTAHDLAIGLGLNITHIRPVGSQGRTLNERDDRSYLVPSTKMAGSYLDTLINQFSHDPALAILAYHLGPTGAQRLVDRASGYRTTLEQVNRYYMYPANRDSDDPISRINYVYSILAFMFIGQNPDQYGFGDVVVPDEEPAGFRDTLYNPHNDLPQTLSI